MEVKFESVEEVFLCFKFWLQQASINLSKTKLWTCQDEHVLRMLDIPRNSVKAKQIRLVSSTKPAHNRVKLNVEGSSLGNPGLSGEGGVVQNDKGELESAFSIFFREATNNEAKLRALIEGLKICRELEVYHIDIECDSPVVMSWILYNKCPLWYLWDFWENLVELLQEFNFQITHQWRECNQVANYLAGMGAKSLSQRFNTWTEMLRLAWGLVRLDMIGVAYLRK